MNLTLDIGNTRVKATVFDGGLIAGRFEATDADKALVETIKAAHPDIEAAIVTSTREDAGQTAETLRLHIPRVLTLDAQTKIPIRNLYSTPSTLGSDRLAAAVGANHLFPTTNILIVDFGTAITFDVVSAAGEFLGGNISPGAAMRFRALHEFTSRLPEGRLTYDVSLTAISTRQAVDSGVIVGIVHEIEGYISHLGRKFDGLSVIFTGGDADYFAKQLKNPIFANYDLVALGLNRILEYNAD